MAHIDRKDEAVERLLRASLQGTSAVTPDCLDAETAAAWADGGLSHGTRDAVELHVAGCGRCQSLLATLVRIEPDAAVDAVSAPARGWLTWLVPLTAAAAIAGIWIALPRTPAEPQGTPMAQVSSVPSEPARRAEAQPVAPAPPAPSVAPPAVSPSSPARADANSQEARSSNGVAVDTRAREADRSADALVTEQAKAGPPAETAASNAQPRAAPPTPAPAAAAPRLEAFADRALARTAAIIVLSPSPAIRWRLTGGVIDRSTDGGATWARVVSVPAELVAGHATSNTVCWVIGRGGLVLRSTDGVTFARLTLPDGAEPVAITATGTDAAVVTTADGRRLVTTDGGAAWTPLLQDF